MDPIASPTTVALNPQQSAAVPALKVGEIIEAQVLQLINATTAKLAIGNSIIEAQTQVALTLGSTVRLAVRNTPDGLRLTLLGNVSNAPATNGAPVGNAPASAGNTSPAAAAPQAAVQAEAQAATQAGAQASAAVSAGEKAAIAAALPSGAQAAVSAGAQSGAAAAAMVADPQIPVQVSAPINPVVNASS